MEIRYFLLHAQPVAVLRYSSNPLQRGNPLPLHCQMMVLLYQHVCK